jgi:3-oxoacyl-[acyl-carrier protein] reductase
MISLENRHAFITGAGTGIGAKCAELFGKAGATVALADINHAAVNQVAAKLKADGINATAHQIDVTNPDNIDAVLAEAESAHGGLDTFVNCAGIIGKNAKIHEMEVADYDAVMNVNMRGVWLSTRAQSRMMIKAGRQGSIVNLASILGIIGQFGVTAYASSKAAVISISYNAALELGPHGIRVNSILPGHTRTQMYIDAGASEIEETLLRIYPTRKLGEAEDVANTALWLSSPLSGQVNGASIVVDGGISNLWNIA